MPLWLRLRVKHLDKEKSTGPTKSPVHFFLVARAEFELMTGVVPIGFSYQVAQFP